MAFLPSSSARYTWPAGAEAAADPGGEEESQHSAHLRPDIHEHRHGTSEESADPSTSVSPLATLMTPGRGVAGSAMPEGVYEGGVIPSMVSSGARFPLDCSAGLYDAGEVSQKKHGPHHLCFVVKFLAVLAAIATAVMLCITQQAQQGQVRWPPSKPFHPSLSKTL